MVNEFRGENRSIQIYESAIGSAIVSGDGNTVYVIHETSEHHREIPTTEVITKISQNPYKGLAAFKESDSDRYFGRKEQIKRLWKRFQSLHEQSKAPRVLPILGPSGCGKSSLVRAGLIPELARRPLPGKEQMQVAILMPGTHPVEALAGVLAKAVTNDPTPAEKTAEFERILWQTDNSGESDGLRRITSQIPNICNSPLVILVDQFEEIYSLCKNIEARQVFVKNLLQAASNPTGNVSIILTLRSDFLGETQQHPKLNDVIGSDLSAIVPAMKPVELRRAIVEPAKLTGHPLDEAVVELLVKDTQGREGALPLLQFALTRIWEGLIADQNPIDIYWEIGGVGGALAGKAQEIYDKLNESEKDITRRVFVGLVQLGEGTRYTRRRVEVENLMAIEDTPEVVKQVIRHFSLPGTRLVSLSSQEGNETAEVTHEALFYHWQLLNDWLNNSRNDIRFQRRLEAGAIYWDKKGRSKGLLWRSPDLDLLRDYQERLAQDMTSLQVDFWQASNRAEQRRNRIKQLVTGGLVAGLVISSLATGLAILNARNANRNKQEAITQSVSTTVQNAAALDASDKKFDALIKILQAGKQFKDNSLSDPVLLNQLKSQFNSVLFNSSLLPYNREIMRLEGNTRGVSSVAFSPDGETIALAGYGDTVELWDRNGTLLNTLEGHGFSSVSVTFSPDGETIASTNFDGTTKLWDRNGTLLNTLEGHSDIVWDVTFSPDGETIASVSLDGTMKLWDRNGTLFNTLKGRGNGFLAIAFSPDGETIALATGRTVELWDRNGTLLNTLKGHRDNVRDVAFSPNGEMIVSVSEDRTVRLWEPNGTSLNTMQGHRGIIWEVAFSPDGETIASASEDRTVRLWDRDGTLLNTLKGHSDSVSAVAFSPDGETIASATGRTVKLWDRNRTLLNTLEDNSSGFRAVAFSPDGKTIASASGDYTVKLWDRNGNLLSILEDDSYWLYSVAFSPDGNTIISASAGPAVRLWDRNGTLINTLEGHSDEVLFSPNGETIASASLDGTVKLWDRNGTLLNTLKGYSDTVKDVAFSPDGETIVSVGGRWVELWDRNGTLLNTLEDDSSGSPLFGAVAFGPDGETIASASGGRTVKLWNRNGTLLNTLEGHSNVVMDVAFSPDGETIASASDDRTVKLWNRNGTLLSTLEGHSNVVMDVAFSPDGETIASASGDGTVKLWLWNLDALMKYACKQVKVYLKSSPNVAPTDRTLCD